MWQANHANINRELANQFPDLWDEICVLHDRGVPSTAPELQRLFAAAFRLGQIACPLLVLAGRYDRALYPRWQREFARHAPQARFVWLERSGSFAHVEEPEALFGLLREFFRTGAGAVHPAT